MSKAKAKKAATADPQPASVDTENSSPEEAEEAPRRALTQMRCPNCGVLMYGVNDRYACTACETYVSPYEG
ncbi:hypothetical protein ACWIG4_18325 [Streptomyces sp. NPDC002248]